MRLTAFGTSTTNIIRWAEPAERIFVTVMILLTGRTFYNSVGFLYSLFFLALSCISS
jgi:hypothetical protein